MFAAVVCSSRRVKRETASQLPPSGGGGGGAPTDVPGPAGAASFSVAWDAPVYDAGYFAGAGAVQVSGYVIDYATSSQALGGTYPYRKVIAGGATLSGNVTGLAAGTYYVRLASYDTDGNVGDYGNEITKVAS